ncbi:hydroxyacylglutathione hydrolase [Granulicella pectinivorans]|uniref:Hydroxyacylglutathione hydrolase n=1 Tax=Granulicella pectinivorans TaxID=474950 RepID=A0A1I6LTW5_9BACT|nr:MBL fold metallo-hydrolase [Granulicella pectinivorans]SFS06927.1 hydroxyacylglutathione hydrolase [Granulicella pectinivorans]
MNVERFEVPGLAQYSYLVSDNGEAAVIDPIRDIDRYIAYAAEHGLRIVAILETHIHADFAAGSVALAAATGAPLCLSAYDEGELYRYAMPHRALHHGERVSIGGARLEAVHTPGHTPEHLSFLLFESGATQPTAMFSGDFLFAGSLGRPDLLGEGAKQGLAHALYGSLTQRLSGLPDALTVYPGHGAGSLCGSGMSGHAATTLGSERATNPFFRLAAEAFVTTILASVPPMPAYYPRMKQLNADGAPVLATLPGASALSVQTVFSASTDPAFVLVDLRTPAEFGDGHIPGAVNIGVEGNLSLWAGWMLDPTKRIVLIGGDGDEAETRLALIRVGLDAIAGHLDGGMPAWTAAGLPVAETVQFAPVDAAAQANTSMLLDVRNEAERREGVIPGSRAAMLGDLLEAVAPIPRDTPLITVCAGGYRASLAASLLLRAGFTHVGSLAGGVGAWLEAGMPLEKQPG